MWYKALGVDIRGYCWLRAVEIPRNWRDIVLHERCSLDRGVTLLCSGGERAGKLVIESGAYINRHCIFDAHERIHVGRDVMMGPFCFVTDANHGMTKGTPIKDQPMSTLPVTIEAEAWIGAHVTILAGVRIGRGAVVGAGSVVTKDIPEDCIAVGIPASVRHRREG